MCCDIHKEHVFFLPLKQNAIYKGYMPTDINIKNFWTVFFELSEEKKKSFLCEYFWTSSQMLTLHYTQYFTYFVKAFI
uniref:HECT domain-containing protein n=1 Tax=Anguilla anguilla TaxID=7936 RepID=A0A0E9XVQ2_ANGAN